MEPRSGQNPTKEVESRSGWTIRWTEGTADDFHRATPPPDPPPEIWIHRPNRPALILGSTQPDGLVDRNAAEADGLEVCRRRSGGGLVFVDPTRDCWIDLIVPAHSRLWDPDIGKAFHWVGHRWAEVLNQPPLALRAVVADSHRTSPAGRLWCFADLGHGEISVEGSKVVGLSQRRTRTWIRIQSLVSWSWPGERLSRYVNPLVLVDRHPDRFPDLDSLDPALVTAGVPDGTPAVPPDELARRFLTGLPQP